jgi:hypothetical protein
VGVWPVFLPIEMYQDHGNRFAVGDVIAWDVLLVDGERQGWPAERLVDSTARIIPRPVWAIRGSLADTGVVRVCWGGPEPAGSVVVLKAGLVADFWNPPIPTTIHAAIHRIEVVRQSTKLNMSGVWMPTGEWRLTPVQRTPSLRGVNPNDPGAEHDVGLLFTVEVSSCSIRNYAVIGTGVGEPGIGPGIERTRPRA